MRIDRWGKVGIGTTSPTLAKLVVEGDAGVGLPYSIWASNYVVSAGALTSSDARIKDIQGRSDSVNDLSTILGIEITDYRYKDVKSKGSAMQKKVIAQQLEKLFPQAVDSLVNTVPDIYQSAAIKDGWIALATDLKPGERVKLIAANDEASVHEVLEVGERSFRTDFKPEGDKIFVFGREVDDFRVVDYDAIAMLNVSATQQIKKELDATQAENAALKSRLEVLEVKDKARDAKLAALEQRLDSGGVPALRAVSLKKD